jgi:hypothetical protein
MFRPTQARMERTVIRLLYNSKPGRQGVDVTAHLYRIARPEEQRRGGFGLADDLVSDSGHVASMLVLDVAPTGGGPDLQE